MAARDEQTPHYSGSSQSPQYTMSQNYPGLPDGFSTQYTDSHEHPHRSSSYSSAGSGMNYSTVATASSLSTPSYSSDLSKYGHYSNNAYSQPTSAPSHYVATTQANYSMSTTMASAPALSMPSFPPIHYPNNILPRLEPAASRDDRYDFNSPMSMAPSPSHTPVHVVGSQGRRGILPSAAGRPPAMRGGDPMGKNFNPQPRPEDGKYVCEHCMKTYLHAKHLKRHMLRHTGVRPYECALCHDTFSRSDILKRHFQKCSMRRGNPTGESHLDFSRANKKRRQKEEEARLAMAASQQYSLPATMAPQPAYAPTAPPPSLGSPLGLGALTSLPQPSYDPQRHEPLVNTVNRQNQMRAMSSSNRGSLSSLNLENPPQTGTGQVTPDSVTTSGAATPYSYYDRNSSVSSPAASNTTYNEMAGYRLPTFPGAINSGSALPQIANERGSALDFDFGTQAASDFSHTYPSGGNTPSHYSYAAKGDDDVTGLGDWSNLGPKH